VRRRRRRRRRRKVCSWANAVNKEGPERDRATQSWRRRSRSRSRRRGRRRGRRRVIQS